LIWLTIIKLKSFIRRSLSVIFHYKVYSCFFYLASFSRRRHAR